MSLLYRRQAVFLLSVLWGRLRGLLMEGDREMTQAPAMWPGPRMGSSWILSFFITLAFALSACWADPPALPQENLPSSLSIQEAVAITLAEHPELAAIRQQRGIAAANVVIAKTYPYNPVAQSTFFGVSGPQNAGITNRLPNQHQITLTVEINGQRGFRTEAAFAALTRTDWDIAAQELQFSVNTVKAYDALLYRQMKLFNNEEFLRINQLGVEQVKKLVESGTLRPADLILARAEVSDIQAQLGMNRSALLTARRDLLRAMGKLVVPQNLKSSLSRVAPSLADKVLLDAAFEHRPELFSKRASISEADAQAKLQAANSWGSPSVGPVYQSDQDRLSFVGAQVSIPIPIFNRRQGEKMLAEAQRTQALLYLQQLETDIRRDVVSSTERVTQAKAWVDNYQQHILPDLRKSLSEIDTLFQQGQPGVDILRVLDVRRKLLKAQDGYLDAQLTYTQALADLSSAVGDPALAMGIYSPEQDTSNKKAP